MLACSVSITCLQTGGSECCSELEFDQNSPAQVSGILPEQLRIFVDATAR